MDYSLSGSSVHEISQARTLEWVAISFSRGSSRLRDWTHVSCIGGWILYQWATREAHLFVKYLAIIPVAQMGVNCSFTRQSPYLILLVSNSFYFSCLPQFELGYMRTKDVSGVFYLGMTYIFVECIKIAQEILETPLHWSLIFISQQQPKISSRLHGNTERIKGLIENNKLPCWVIYSEKRTLKIFNSASTLSEAWGPGLEALPPQAKCPQTCWRTGFMMWLPLQLPLPHYQDAFWAAPASSHPDFDSRVQSRWIWLVGIYDLAARKA